MKKSLLIFDIIAIIAIVVILIVVNNNSKKKVEKNNYQVSENKIESNQNIYFNDMSDEEKRKWTPLELQDFNNKVILLHSNKITFNKNINKYTLDTTLKNISESVISKKNIEINLLDGSNNSIENLYITIDNLDNEEEQKYNITINSNKDDVKGIKISDLELTKLYKFNSELESNNIDNFKIADKTLNNISFTNIRPMRINNKPLLSINLRNNSNDVIDNKMIKVEVLNIENKVIDSIFFSIDKINANETMYIGIELNVDQSKAKDINISEIKF